MDFEANHVKFDRSMNKRISDVVDYLRDRDNANEVKAVMAIVELEIFYKELKEKGELIDDLIFKDGGVHIIDQKLSDYFKSLEKSIENYKIKVMNHVPGSYLNSSKNNRNLYK